MPGRYTSYAVIFQLGVKSVPNPEALEAYDVFVTSYPNRVMLLVSLWRRHMGTHGQNTPLCNEHFQSVFITEPFGVVNNWKKWETWYLLLQAVTRWEGIPCPGCGEKHTSSCDVVCHCEGIWNLSRCMDLEKKKFQQRKDHKTKSE